MQMCYAQKVVVKKDLKADWKIYQDDQYLSYAEAGKEASSVYFQIRLAEFSKDLLYINDTETFSLFLNGKFVASTQHLTLKIDSLRKVFSSAVVTCAIHQKQGITKTLVTQIKSTMPPANKAEIILEERSSSFRDFVIISFMILVIMLITIVRLNPKLASDYFSITKIFFLRESDDAQVYSRITSSTNILFYVFCSLMLSYYLMIIFHFVPQHHPVAFSFHSQSFGMAMLQWLKLSGIVLAAFFLKIILIYSLTAMFGSGELASIHFFNWVRVVLIFFGALTIVLSVYFIMHGQEVNFFTTLLQLLAWVLAGWMILIALKLSSRMGRSVFHLFSYICATELIPFLITLKVLYN
jgi:hypothetical protein